MTSKLLSGLVPVLALHASLALGQVRPAPTPAEGWQTTFFESPTTALPLLTTAAIKHSAALKGLDLAKAIGEEDLKLARKSLYGIVGFGGGYTYGNLATIASDPKNPNNFGTSNSGRYSVGVNLALPLSTIVNRGNVLRREELTLQRTETTRQEGVDQMRQQIIQLYQNVVLARKVLTLQQEALLNARTNYQLSERQFRQGQLTLPGLSDANGQLTSASIAVESARSQYDTAFMILEEVVGAKISTLMTSSR